MIVLLVCSLTLNILWLFRIIVLERRLELHSRALQIILPAVADLITNQETLAQSVVGLSNCTTKQVEINNEVIKNFTDIKTKLGTQSRWDIFGKN